MNETTPHQNMIRLFPVPAKDHIFIETNFPVSEIILTDITGKIIIRTNKTSVDIRGLEQGVYLLKAQEQNGQRSATTRFIKTN